MSSSSRKAPSNPPKRDDSSICRKINAVTIVGEFTAKMSYKIEMSNIRERIGHGQLWINNCRQDVSFLLFSSIKEQENIHGNLTSIQHPSMAKVIYPPLGSVRIGAKDRYPIAIERISSMLNAFVERHKEKIWNGENLNNTFQQIARDMIDGMAFIHGNDKIHGRKISSIRKIFCSTTEGATPLKNSKYCL